MKKTRILLVMLLMISCLLNITAQEELPKFQVYYLGDELVKSSMVSEYELALKDYIALFAENNYPYPIYVYSTNDYHYYYVTPTESRYSELDSIRKHVGKVYSNNPEKWEAVWKKFEGTYDYYKPEVIVLNRELSYTPENPRLKQEEENFNYWVFTYVKVGKTKEFVEIIKKWKELYKNNNISDGFNIYWGDLGSEQPLYIWHMTGKDAADFWTQANSSHEILGEEAKILWEQTAKLTRKIENKDGWFRPKLSYFLEEK